MFSQVHISSSIVSFMCSNLITSSSSSDSLHNFIITIKFQFYKFDFICQIVSGYKCISLTFQSMHADVVLQQRMWLNNAAADTRAPVQIVCKWLQLLFVQLAVRSGSAAWPASLSSSIQWFIARMKYFYARQNVFAISSSFTTQSWDIQNDPEWLSNKWGTRRKFIRRVIKVIRIRSSKPFYLCIKI